MDWLKGTCHVPDPLCLPPEYALAFTALLGTAFLILILRMKGTTP